MKEFSTTRGKAVDANDVLSYEETTPKGRTYLVQLVAACVVRAEVLDDCGQCEECYTNGMPQFCQSPTRTRAFFYKTPNDKNRLWGNLEEGFYLNLCYEVQ